MNRLQYNKVHFIQIRYHSIISPNTKLSFPEKQLLQSKQFMRTKTRTLARSQGRVVILGSGWAGFKLMRELDKQNYDVSVVSPRNYFVFTPLLASTSVGTLEFRCITEPIRGYSKDINYYQAFCDKIDQEPKTFSLDYDKLVISVGSYSNTFGIPGVKENAYFLKDVQDARNIRKRLIECFEYASQPGLSDEEKENKLHFVVVGGGPTGIEFSAELYDFIANDLARIYPDLIDKTRMTLYDVAPKILSSFDSQLAEYAHRKFNRKGIQIKTQKSVEEVNANHIVLKDDGKVPYGLLVWSTGLMRNPLVDSFVQAKKDGSGQRIVTDGQLRVIDNETDLPFSNIYALGDCSTIEGNDLPATAQVATQKSDYLCKVLNLSAKKGYQEKTDDFKFKNRGMMAYIGSSEALVDMSSVHAMAKQSGRLSWLLWRSAYFSMSMNIRNRMLIAYHWFLTWSLGRDISRF
ncbi:FAD/NAD-P-binding domain-containing protein [Backusella circina FSU 941]|nr:FAD/NAD-P-binding domain-containing protein [Backusella circina FSU 941]